MSDGTYADELKPCPFCRGKNLLFVTAGLPGYCCIQCFTCTARGPDAKTWRWCKAKWNNRRMVSGS